MCLTNEQRVETEELIADWNKDIIQWLEGGYKIREGGYAYALKWCTGEPADVLTDTHYFNLDCLKAYNRFTHKPNITNARKLVHALEEMLNDSN